MVLFSLILAGCQEKSTTTNNNSTSNPATSCVGNAYYTTPGCPGYTGTTNGTTIGGTTGSTSCVGNATYTTPGCPGYCSYYPSTPGCSGSTTGGTVGGTTGSNCTSPIAKTCSNYCDVYPGALGCLPNGTNCWVNNSATGCPGSAAPINPTGSKHYPGGAPVGVCQDATGANLLPTRKAEVIGSYLYNYNPIEPITASFLNTTDILKTVGSSRTFFMTDSLLKLRVKVKEQYDLTGNSDKFCLGRRTPGTRVPGYTKLMYTVKVYGVTDTNAVTGTNTVTYLGTAGTYITGVNSCSPAINLSVYKEVSPTGVIVVIDGIQSNQNINCTASASVGYRDCNQYRTVRDFDCWGMELEVAADGTKTFN